MNSTSDEVRRSPEASPYAVPPCGSPVCASTTVLRTVC
ncbi:hypothetical protein STXM2123_2667 [Streptomyces sp. F-3]|nr:hypothetical protein STXM2123_2667 [Streptomyces sp. F-3]